MYVGGAPRSRPTPGLLLRGPRRMGDTEEGVCVPLRLSLPLLPSTRKGRLCRGDPLRVPFAKRRQCTRLRVNENPPTHRAPGARDAHTREPGGARERPRPGPRQRRARGLRAPPPPNAGSSSPATSPCSRVLRGGGGEGGEGGSVKHWNKWRFDRQRLAAPTLPLSMFQKLEILNKLKDNE